MPEGVEYIRKQGGVYEILPTQNSLNSLTYVICLLILEHIAHFISVML